MKIFHSRLFSKFAKIWNQRINISSFFKRSILYFRILKSQLSIIVLRLFSYFHQKKKYSQGKFDLHDKFTLQINQTAISLRCYSTVYSKNLGQDKSRINSTRGSLSSVCIYISILFFLKEFPERRLIPFDVPVKRDQYPVAARPKLPFIRYRDTFTSRSGLNNWPRAVHRNQGIFSVILFHR